MIGGALCLNSSRNSPSGGKLLSPVSSPPSDMTARQIADLIASHAAALALFARQWCANPEDAVQDAFAANSSASPRPPGDPVAWLFKVVRTTAIDRGRDLTVGG